jgi:hypothetical protein
MAGALSGAMAAPGDQTNTNSVQIKGVTNFAINCTGTPSYPGGPNFENCVLAQGDQVQCPAGQIPTGVRVTLGGGYIATGVDAKNVGASSACYNIEQVTHDFIKLRVPSVPALGQINGTAGSSGGSGVELAIGQCGTAAFVPDDVFKYVRPPNGTIFKPIVPLSGSLVLTERSANAPVTFTPGANPAEFNAFYGSGTYNYEFSALASEDAQSPGTWEGGVFTDAGATISVEAICETPPPPELVCDFKTLSPTVLDGPDGIIGATLQFRAANNLSPLSVSIVDSMGAKMTYLDSANPPPSSTSPLTWSHTFPADTGADPLFQASYQAQVTGLTPGESVCNVVTATGGTLSDSCRVCVTRPDTPSVPAIGVLGAATLGLGLSGLGLLIGFRRRG